MIQASVVIPTCNRPKDLQHCLEALLSQSLSHDTYEIIVAPYGSPDQTESLASPLDARVRSTQQFSEDRSAAMNDGVRMARGSIVIFLSDDCICDPGLVIAHVEAHKRDQNLFVSGLIRIHPECPTTAVTAFETESRQQAFLRWETDGICPLQLTFWTNSSAPRTLFDKHPFNQTCIGSTNIEPLIRLLRTGARIQHAPAAIAYQRCDKTARAIISNAENFAACEVNLAKVYPEYRSMSSIARWNSDRIHLRLVRRLVALAPFSIEPILSFLFLIVHAFRKHPPLLRLAQRLLRFRIEVVTCRAAVSAAGSWQRLRDLFLLRVPILLYHNVISDTERPPDRFTMTQSTFARQIRWLSQIGCQGISVSDYLGWRESNSPLPPKPILITFDDAYNDAANYAFPVLEKFGFSAACMVVTGEIAKINRWDSVRGGKTFELMDEAGLLEWKRRGIEYGAHTCSHPDLRTLGDDELRNELAGSRQALEQLTGSTVRTFAYPYGFLDRRVRDQAARVYDFAFTTVPRPSNLATDPLLLGRMEPLSSDTRFDLISRLRWGWTPRARARAALSKFSGRGERTAMDKG